MSKFCTSCGANVSQNSKPAQKNVRQRYIVKSETDASLLLRRAVFSARWFFMGGVFSIANSVSKGRTSSYIGVSRCISGMTLSVIGLRHLLLMVNTEKVS
mgnify:CR=1 FL=1